MMFRRLAILLAFVIALPAQAEEIVAGLSQARVSITTDFKGSEIVVFGAVKREERIPKNDPLHVIVTVTGPSMPVTVRKKSREMGIWINTEAVDVRYAPTFYAVRSTGPLGDILNDFEDIINRISIDRAIRAVSAAQGKESIADFTDALIRIRSEQDLYQIRPSSIELLEDTLFQTGIALPSNLTEGDYTTRIYLTRSGRIIDKYETVIGVQKVGIERFLYVLAQEAPFSYGMLALAIAIAAGWGASVAFSLMRR